MARKTVFVSDISGKSIEEGKGAKIRITFDDARRGSYELTPRPTRPRNSVARVAR